MLVAKDSLGKPLVLSRLVDKKEFVRQAMTQRQIKRSLANWRYYQTHKTKRKVYFKRYRRRTRLKRSRYQREYYLENKNALKLKRCYRGEGVSIER